VERVSGAVTRATARQITFADVERMRQGVCLEPLFAPFRSSLTAKGRRGLTTPLDHLMLISSTGVHNTTATGTNCTLPCRLCTSNTLPPSSADAAGGP